MQISSTAAFEGAQTRTGFLAVHEPLGRVCRSAMVRAYLLLFGSVWVAWDRRDMMSDELKMPRIVFVFPVPVKR